MEQGVAFNALNFTFNHLNAANSLGRRHGGLGLHLPERHQRGPEDPVPAVHRPERRRRASPATASTQGDWFVWSGFNGPDNRGAFGPNRSRRIAEFTDGTSNTLFATDVKVYQPLCGFSRRSPTSTSPTDRLPTPTPTRTPSAPEYAVACVPGPGRTPSGPTATRTRPSMTTAWPPNKADLRQRRRPGRPRPRDQADRPGRPDLRRDHRPELPPRRRQRPARRRQRPLRQVHGQRTLAGPRDRPAAARSISCDASDPS